MYGKRAAVSPEIDSCVFRGKRCRQEINAGCRMEHEYKEEFYSVYCEKEEIQWSVRPRNGLKDIQNDISANMRDILVNWLNEVVDDFQLNKHTLFLAIELVDRVLESQVICKSKLQLVGITCLFIAAKYEEVSVPPMQNFVDITNSSYSCNELLNSERQILTALNFQLSYVTILNFLNWLISAYKINDIRVLHCAHYLAEIVVAKYYFRLKYRPSKLAAAIICLTIQMLNIQAWVSNISHKVEK